MPGVELDQRGGVTGVHHHPLGIGNDLGRHHDAEASGGGRPDDALGDDRAAVPFGVEVLELGPDRSPGQSRRMQPLHLGVQAGEAHVVQQDVARDSGEHVECLDVERRIADEVQHVVEDPAAVHEARQVGQPFELDPVDRVERRRILVDECGDVEVIGEVFQQPGRVVRDARRLRGQGSDERERRSASGSGRRPLGQRGQGVDRCGRRPFPTECLGRLGTQFIEPCLGFERVA